MRESTIEHNFNLIPKAQRLKFKISKNVATDVRLRRWMAMVT